MHINFAYRLIEITCHTLVNRTHHKNEDTKTHPYSNDHCHPVADGVQWLQEERPNNTSFEHGEMLKKTFFYSLFLLFTKKGGIFAR